MGSPCCRRRYIVVGNDRTFPALNDIVAFHKKHAVNVDIGNLTNAAEADGFRTDLDELAN